MNVKRGNIVQYISDNKEIAYNNKLIHTLLFLFRESKSEEDKRIATICLKSLEKGTYKTVVIYNQGYLTDDQLKEFLSQFNLNCIVIGIGSNIGTVIGRQSCFEYIWDKYPETEFISELHLDMIFTFNWEDPLVDYLQHNDEPLMSAGIVDKEGNLNFLETKADNFTEEFAITDDFLMNLRCDKVVHGFTNPCIHVSKILKVTGGYNSRFLKGKQCYEDDSMLLGYYYYYGTRLNWHPKVNYNSVVYHAVAGQRLEVPGNVRLNYEGLVQQYGAMGLKHLSQLHKSDWQIRYFMQKFNAM